MKKIILRKFAGFVRFLLFVMVTLLVVTGLSSRVKAESYESKQPPSSVKADGQWKATLVWFSRDKKQPAVGQVPAEKKKPLSMDTLPKRKKPLSMDTLPAEKRSKKPLSMDTLPR